MSSSEPTPLETFFSRREKQASVKTVHRTIIRLEQSVFDHLVNEVNGTCLVTSATTDLQAGFQLGMQHVLNHIRKTLVIETSGTK